MHEVSYDSQGRMRYNPDFHPNHGKPFTTDELIYIAKFYEYDGRKGLSMALGRTEFTILRKVDELRKSGLYEVYKRMSDDEWLKYAEGS